VLDILNAEYPNSSVTIISVVKEVEDGIFKERKLQVKVLP